MAPLWSGLIALLNEKLGKPLGFLQPALYGLPPGGRRFSRHHERIERSVFGGPGWDAATGLGSPSGENLLEALEGPDAAASRKNLKA